MRLKWNEIDEQLNRETISENLIDIKEDKSTSENIKTLTDILKIYVISPGHSGTHNNYVLSITWFISG